MKIRYARVSTKHQRESLDQQIHFKVSRLPRNLL